MALALQILLNGVVIGSLYALVALGFQFSYSATKFFNIAYGAIYAASAYLCLFWISVFTAVQPEQNKLQIAVAAILGIGSAWFLAWLAERHVYFPLFRRNAPSLVIFIASLGVYLVIVNSIGILWGDERRVLTNALQDSVRVRGIVITYIQLVQFLVSGTLIVAMLAVLRTTRIGQRIRAIADNPALASTVGVSIRNVRLAVFFIGSAAAGSAAVLRSLDVGVNPQAGFAAVLIAAVAVVLGGADSPVGAVIGAFCLSGVQAVAIWAISAEWQEAASFAFLILILSMRSRGIFFIRERVEAK
jgi:branched-chain amino acid transport system permease protein